MKSEISHKIEVWLRKAYVRVPILITVFGLLLLTISPIIGPYQKVEAAGQLTTRALSISTAKAAVSSNWTFTFDVATTTGIVAIKFLPCDSALGTYGREGNASGCATGGYPTSISFASASFSSQTNFSNNATSFSKNTSSNTFCDGTVSQMLCMSRASAGTETQSSSNLHTLVVNGVTNPNITQPNNTFYVGIYTYAATGNSTAIDSGTVASAITQTLQVTASVIEILQFCVGASTVNDLTTAVGSACGSAPGAGSTVGLGTLDATAIAVSPVAASPNNGTNTNGIAILRTNAQNGTSVYYDAIQSASGSGNLGALRIQAASTSCSGSSTTDGCINSRGATQGTFTAGTENFGFTIAGVSCVTEQAYASPPYSCAYTSGTEHLVPQSNYVGSTGAYGHANGYAFVDTASTNTKIAAAASGNAVTDEALIMQFAATPAVSTVYGSYSVNIDYTAVSAY